MITSDSSAGLPTPRVRVNDRWVFWGLLGLLFWLPLPLGTNRNWAVALLIFWSQLLLGGALFAWRGHALLAFERLSVFRWPLGFLSAFVAYVWLQCLPLPISWLTVLSPETAAVWAGAAWAPISLDPQQTQIYAALSFGYWSCFVVALLTIRDAQRLDRLAYALVLSGLLQAVVGAVLFSMGAHYRLFFSEVVHNNVVGTFVNRNHMAGYMEICLSVGVGLMLARLGGESRPMRRSWKNRLSGAIDFMLSPKMRLRLMLVVMVIALVLTRSRMGNTGFFAAMLVVGSLAIVLSRKTAPKTVALIASLIIIDVLVIGTWVGLEKVVSRVQETSLAVDGGGREESLELRQDAALHAIDLVADFPVFGTGAGSFYMAYMPYRTPREGYFDHAHNDYVEIAADFGLLGMGILGGFVLSTLVAGVLVLVKRRSSLPRGIAFGSLMAMVALIIHSTVDFNLQIPANALTLVIVMAMAWLARALPPGRPPGAGCG